MHLQQPLRYYFQPGVDEVIMDRMHSEVQWKRDQSLPYSSADDYAVIARFRKINVIQGKTWTPSILAAYAW
jgi:transposase